MDNVIHEKELKEMFDQVIREVTERAGGIHLHVSAEEPVGNICTVYAEFERGFHTSVSMCADESLFARLTRYMMNTDDIAPQDLEDFSKEFFNILCGHIAAKVFQATKVASRFGIPSFYRGRFEPADQEPHFVLSYTSDWNERVQLTHHSPFGLDTI